jgi:hypothetical protein
MKIGSQRDDCALATVIETRNGTSYETRVGALTDMTYHTVRLSFHWAARWIVGIIVLLTILPFHNVAPHRFDDRRQLVAHEPDP